MDPACQCWTVDLQQLWDHYMLISPDLISLKATAMHRFLKEYTSVDRSSSCELVSGTNAKRCMRASMELTSIGNVITREFLLHVKAACTVLPACLPVEASRQIPAAAIADPAATGGVSQVRLDSGALLKQLLIDGEGWMFLVAMLQSGTRGLNYGRDLSGLLLSLFSMCMQLAVHEGRESSESKEMAGNVIGALGKDQSDLKYLSVSTLCDPVSIGDTSMADVSKRLWPRRQSLASRRGSVDPTYGGSGWSSVLGLNMSNAAPASGPAALLLSNKITAGAHCSGAGYAIPPRCAGDGTPCSMADVGVYCLCLLSSMCCSSSALPTIPLALPGHATANSDVAAVVAAELTKVLTNLYLGGGSGMIGCVGLGSGEHPSTWPTASLLWLQRHAVRVAVCAGSSIVQQLQSVRPLASNGLLKALLAVGCASLGTFEHGQASCCEAAASAAASPHHGATVGAEAVGSAPARPCAAEEPSPCPVCCGEVGRPFCCSSSGSIGSSSTRCEQPRLLPLLLAADAVQGALELLACGFTHGQQQSVGQMTQLVVDFCEAGGTWLAARVVEQCQLAADHHCCCRCCCFGTSSSGSHPSTDKRCATTEGALGRKEALAAVRAILDGAALALCALKSCKVKYVHTMTCLKKGHRKCNYESHFHHHHDAFAIALDPTGLGEAARSGSSTFAVTDRWHATSADRDTGYGSGSGFVGGGGRSSATGAFEVRSAEVCAESRHCAAAALSELLLRSFAALPGGVPARAAGLDLISRVGLCCCLPIGTVVDCFLAGIEHESHAQQDATLGALSTALLQHLGGAAAVASGDSTSVSSAVSALLPSAICRLCQLTDLPSDLPATESARAGKGGTLPTMAQTWPDRGSCLDGADEATAACQHSIGRRWHDVSRLGELLRCSDERLGMLVLKHVGGMLRAAAGSLRQELFVSVYFSHIQALAAAGSSGGSEPALLAPAANPRAVPLAGTSAAAACAPSRRLLVQHCLRALPSLLSVPAVRQMFVACSGVELLETCARSSGLLRGSLKVYVVLITCLDTYTDLMATFCQPDVIIASFLDMLLVDCNAYLCTDRLSGEVGGPAHPNLRSGATCKRVTDKWQACGLLLMRCRKLQLAFEQQSGPLACLRLLETTIVTLRSAAAAVASEVAAKRGSTGHSSRRLGMHRRCARLLRLLQVVFGVCQQCVHLHLPLSAEVREESGLLALIDVELLRKLPASNEFLAASVASLLFEAAVQRLPKDGPVVIDDKSETEECEWDGSGSGDSNDSSSAISSSGDGSDQPSRHGACDRELSPTVPMDEQWLSYEYPAAASSTSDADGTGAQSDNESSTNGYDADNELNQASHRFTGSGAIDRSVSFAVSAAEYKSTGSSHGKEGVVDQTASDAITATIASSWLPYASGSYDFVEIACPRLLQMTTTWLVDHQGCFGAVSLQRLLRCLLSVLGASGSLEWLDEKQSIVESLLTGFRAFLTVVNDDHKRGVQQVLLDLIILLCSKNVTTTSLLQILFLLKSSDYKGPLLRALHDITARSTFQPRCCIAFPQRSAQQGRRSTPAQGACGGSSHPWGVDVAIAKSHLLVKFFPWKDVHSNFSVALWLFCSGSLLHHRTHRGAGGRRRSDAAAGAVYRSTADSGKNSGNDSEASGSEIEPRVLISQRRTSVGSTLSHGVIEKYLHLVSIGSCQLSVELWANPASGNLLVRFMSQSLGEDEVLSDMIFSNIFTTNRWQHMCASTSIDIKDKQACLELTCVVDGCRSYHEKAWVDLPRKKLAMSASDVSTISIGQSSSSTYTAQVMSIGNVMLFRDLLSLPNCLQLFSEGPDANSCSWCESSDGFQFDRSTTFSAEVLQHVASAESVLKPSDFTIRDSKKKLADLICMVVSPELKQHCIVYPWHQPPSRPRGPSMSMLKRLVSVVGRSGGTPAQPPPLLQQSQQPGVPPVTGGGTITVSSTDDGISDDVDGQLLLIQPSMHSVAYERNAILRHHTDILEALVPLGGIQLAIFMLAKTVELAMDAGEQQAMALDVLLHIAHKSTALAKEFSRLSGALMLSRITTSSRFCSHSPAIMKVLLKYSFSNLNMAFEDTGGFTSLYSWTFGQPNALLQQQSRDLVIIRDTALIQHVLLDCGTWQKATMPFVTSYNACRAEDVWLGAFIALKACVSPSNIFKHYNIHKMSTDGILSRLLVMPLEWLRHAEESLCSSVSIMNALVEIIECVLTECQGSENFCRMLQDVCNLLLLLHPAAATFVYYDKQLSYVQQYYGADWESNIYSSDGGITTLSSSNLSSHSSLTSRRVSSLSAIHLASTVHSSLQQTCQQSERSHSLSPSNEGCRTRSSSCPGASEWPASAGMSRSVSSCMLPPPAPDLAVGLVREEGARLSSMIVQGDNALLDSNLNDVNENSIPNSDLRVSSDPLAAHVTGMATLHGGLLGAFDGIAKRVGGSVFLDLSRECSFTPETVIVYLNHDSPLVRLQALQLLNTMLTAMPAADVASFVENEGFHHIASQLRQHTPTAGLVDTCLSMLRCCPTASCCLQSGMADAPEPLLLPATIPLMAMLDKMVADHRLLISTLSSLKELFSENSRFAGYLFERGLFESLCNTMGAVLSHIQSMGDSATVQSEYRALLNDLRHFMTDVVIYLQSVATTENDMCILDETFALLIAVQRKQQRATVTVGSVPAWYETAVDKTIMEMYMGIFNEVRSQALSVPGSPAAAQEKSDRPGFNVTRFHPGNIPHIFTGTMGSEVSTPATVNSSVGNSNIHRRFVPRAMWAASTLSGSGSGKPDRQLLRVKLEWLLLHSTQYVIFREAHLTDVNKERAESVDSEVAVTGLLSIVAACAVPSSSDPIGDNSGGSGAWHQQLPSIQTTLKDHITQLVEYFLSPVCSINEASTFAAEATLLQVPIMTSGLQIPWRMVASFIERCGCRLTARQLAFVSQLSSDRPTFTSQHVGIQTSSEVPGDWSQWSAKHSAARRMWEDRLLQFIRSAAHRATAPLDRISQLAMKATRDVVNIQNCARQKLTDYLKTTIATAARTEKSLRDLVQRITHERAVWHDERYAANAWQLDPTEGPARMRKRLMPCRLRIEPRRLLPERRCASKSLSDGGSAAGEGEVLAYLFDDGRQAPAVTATTTASGPPSADAQQASGKPLQRGASSHAGGSAAAAAVLVSRLDADEKIVDTFRCVSVALHSSTHGELLVGQKALYFAGDDDVSHGCGGIDVIESSGQVPRGQKSILTITWLLEDIEDIKKRRHRLQDNALEMFLTSGRTALIAFESEKERDAVWQKLEELGMLATAGGAGGKASPVLELAQSLWLNGRMTNFEYIMHLNTAAGRSFNDLMQYPVFPYVLADYESAILNLHDPSSYRNLLKPIACQKPENENRYISHYKENLNHRASAGGACGGGGGRSAVLAPYHYASLYSNSGVVLHYMVRLLPYTLLFLQYQDGNFDLPDRTFHSLATSWHLSSDRSQTDVKELTPEFFSMHEFLCNDEGFDFGKRHCGEVVYNVELPPWCRNDPRLFVLVHRQVLESELVSSRLGHWIDLIFGYKQTGRAAIDAVNVFHPATYHGLDLDTIEDALQRRALAVMIQTYGQVPRQLFKQPHPPLEISDSSLTITSLMATMSPLADSQSIEVESLGDSMTISSMRNGRNNSGQMPGQAALPVMKEVIGLHWGMFVGSPECSDPVLVRDEVLPEPVHSLVALPTGQVLGHSKDKQLIVLFAPTATYKGTAIKGASILPTEPRCATLLHWSTVDNVLRWRRSKSSPVTNFVHLGGKASCCAVSQWNCRQLILGYFTGIIQVYPLQIEVRADKKVNVTTASKASVCLYGHLSPVRHLFVCVEYSIFISTDDDGIIIIWDLNRLTYVRSLSVGTSTSKEVIDCLTVSATLGDIAIASHGAGVEGTSTLRLLTINARSVGTVLTAQHESIVCLAYSTLMEGRGVNVVAAGLNCGIIRLWSSWDLQHVRDIYTPNSADCVISVAFSYDCQRLVAVTQASKLLMWVRGPAGIRQSSAMQHASSAAGNGSSSRRQQLFTYWSEL